jgi:hypothetical protein
MKQQRFYRYDYDETEKRLVVFELPIPTVLIRKQQKRNG